MLFRSRAHLESQSKWWRANTERPTMSVDEIEKIAARKGVDNLGMERWLREMVGMEITEDNRGDFVGTTYKGRRQLLNRPGILPSGLRTETEDTDTWIQTNLQDGSLVQYKINDAGKIDPESLEVLNEGQTRWSVSWEKDASGSLSRLVAVNTLNPSEEIGRAHV